MKKLIKRYIALSFEQRLILHTVIGLCFSAALAMGKFVVGLITDYNLCTIALYTFALLAAKLECVLGVKTNKRSFRTRNILVAVFLFISSLLYVGFMVRMFFLERTAQKQPLEYVLIIAFISFCELGFAIAGILRTKNKGHLYRDIKIINFCIALIAILTTQIAILNYTGMENRDEYNAYTGIGVGIFITLCAVYILLAPKLSVIDREHNTFELRDEEKNALVDMQSDTVEITLCKSAVYGSFIYRARVRDKLVDGHIVRGQSLWKKMHVSLKILCCILSELLLPAWLIGRFVLMLRSIDIPRRLKRKMIKNGFVKV